MKLKTKDIIYLSVFIALFVVFGKFATIEMWGMKLTLQNLPILVAAVLLGPFGGAITGCIGMLISQIISPYGITATTILWILPQTIIGYLFGFVMESSEIFIDIGGGKKNLLIWLLFVHILLTILNTVVLYIDSKIMGYYSFPYVFGSLLIRFIASIIMALVYDVLIPIIVDKIKKIH